MIISMSKAEFMEKETLFAETVTDAFKQFKAATVRADKPEQMLEFVRRVYSLNQGEAYCDFYYAGLKEEEQERFRSGLDSEDKEVFSRFEIDSGQVYYPLTEDSIEFLLKMTLREWLFSTFYFAGKKVTIWGNYGQSFPIFCKDAKTLNDYLKIANQCGLECIYMKTEGRKVSESRVETVHLVRPNHLNAAGRLFGGMLMQWIDEVAGLVAKRHTRMNVITASVDTLRFLRGAYQKDVIVIIGRATHVGNTSMEVEVDTYVEGTDGTRTQINHAYFTMVAIDEEDKPAPIPILILETDEEKEKWKRAEKRREMRIQRNKEGF